MPHLMTIPTPGARTMLTSPRFPEQSNKDELPKDLMELVAAVESLPAPFRTQLEPLTARVMESTRRRRRILLLVQEALGQLRLDMKYLVFDLEATRRERDTYRQNPEREGDDEVR
jgi:hypothetical protein